MLSCSAREPREGTLDAAAVRRPVPGVARQDPDGRMFRRRRAMVAPHTRVPVWLCVLTIAACAEPSDPVALVAPSLAAGGVGRPSVLVNPNSDDRGTARTIQEGIDMVASGGKVMAVPGTYKERVVIDK